MFAGRIFAILISGAALADYFHAHDANWRSIHLGSAIFSAILLIIHLLKHIRGKKLYAAASLSFILAGGAIFGLPYVDRWFHKIEINRSELLSGEKLAVEGKILIVYFSRVINTNFPAEIDAVSGAALMIDDKKSSETRKWSLKSCKVSQADKFLRFKPKKFIPQSIPRLQRLQKPNLTQKNCLNLKICPKSPITTKLFWFIRYGGAICQNWSKISW